MSEVLQDLSAPALVYAIEANMFELFPLIRHVPQAEMHVAPDISWCITDIPFPMLNMIARARLAPDGVDAAIQAAIARGETRHVPLAWWTGPATRPADLGAHLVAHGFTHWGDSPGMAANLLALNDDLPTPRGLMIEPIADAESLKQWCHTFVVGFEWPEFTENAWLNWARSSGFGAQSPLRHYMGLLEGEPVATASVFYGAGVAGIYNVATVPQARRKGIGAAITLAPLRDARALGYRAAVLSASDMGFGVYHKIGFREHCKIGAYGWKPDTEQEE